jgi:peroxiredoxin
MLKLSRQVDLGKRAHDFALPDTDGTIRTLAEFAGSPALLVVFICNHCPFVLHLIDHLAGFASAYAPRGLQVVAISSNDAADHPEDAPELMSSFAHEHGFAFPYLYDATQTIALAYGAICTPDFFLYDADCQLAYCGQYDASRPKINRPPMPGMPPLPVGLPVTGVDMRAAVDAVLHGAPIPAPQVPSAGCSIKWKPGNSPSWG